MKSSDTRAFVIIGASVLFLIYQYGGRFLPGRPSAAPASQNQSAGQAQKASAPTVIPVPLPEPTGERPQIPPTGWGRNPFLTPAEIEALSQKPEEQPIAETTTTRIPTAKPAGPAGMPTYSLTAIFSGRGGKWAMVDSRMVQAGDRLGNEIVEEIKENAVVLGFDGRTRELRLKRLDEVRPPAKGETKQGEAKQ